MSNISQYQQNYKEWRYKLISALGDSLLEINPIGWDSKELSLTRNEKYQGIFRTYSADLEFIRNGYDILKELEETTGIESECELSVEKRDTTSGSDTEIFRSKLDFSELTESSKNGLGIKMPLVDSSFLEKLKSRENIEIPYDRAEDLDGGTINSGTYTDISLLGREYGGTATGLIYEDVDPIIDDLNFYAFSTGFINYVLNTSFDNVDVLPDFSNATKRGYNGNVVSNITSSDCFYFIENGDADLSGTLNIVAYSDETNIVVSLFKAQFNSVGSVIAGTEMQIVHNPPIGNNLNYSYDYETTLNENEGLFIIVNATIDSGSMVALEGFNISVNYKSRFEPTPCKVVLPHEAFDYMVTAITGVQNSFRSNYFGRTDLGYAEDGEGAYISLTNGKLIRGFDVGYTTDNEEIKSQLTFKFSELFENYYKLKNIGIKVVYEDGRHIVEAEPMIELFTEEVIHTVTPDRDILERVRNIDMYYSEIQAGYNIEPTDLFGGLEEYCNKEYYNTNLGNVNNMFNLVCSYSASGIQIEKQRRYQSSRYPSTELEQDLKNFFVELWLDGVDIVQRNEQGFDDIQGLEGLETKINLGLTPNQIIRNHGWEMSNGLYKNQLAKIKYNKSDKVTDLKYQITGGNLIIENADIQVSELDYAKMSGYNLEFSSPLSLSDFMTIRNNPYGLIKVWSKLSNEYIYGWINEISTEPVDKPANWSLIEAFPPDIGTIKLLSTNLDEIILTNTDNAIEII